MVRQLRPNEKVLADRGYRDLRYFILPDPVNTRRHNLIMARHETVNARLKIFGILTQRFRHEVSKHPSVFHALVNILSLILVDEPLFNIH